MFHSPTLFFLMLSSQTLFRLVGMFANSLTVSAVALAGRKIDFPLRFVAPRDTYICVRSDRAWKLDFCCWSTLDSTTNKFSIVSLSSLLNKQHKSSPNNTISLAHNFRHWTALAWDPPMGQLEHTNDNVGKPQRSRANENSQNSRGDHSNCSSAVNDVNDDKIQ